MRTLWHTILFSMMSFSLTAGDEAPFAVSAALYESDKGEKLLSVSFSIQNQHYLYGDQIKIEAPRDVQLLPKKIPQTAEKYDESTGLTNAVYVGKATFIYAVTGNTATPMEI